MEAPLSESPQSAVSANTPPERARHTHRKRRGGGLIIKLVAGWILFIGLIVFGARKLWPEEKPLTADTTVILDAPSEEEEEFLNEVMPKLSTIYQGFLVASTPEERNQFVFSPISTVARMSRFYGMNPMVKIDPADLRMTARSVLHLPGRRSAETQWITTEGRRLDAVFTEENGEWRLDWDHYVRYGDLPWALFLSGSGEDSGEFRLLARERLADEREDSADISIILYAPRLGDSGETGFASPEFLVPRASKNGRMLDAAFKLDRKGGSAFGVKVPNINPEGLIRIRARVRRVVENEERRVELEEIVACHWYSIAEPGMDIPTK